MFDRNTTPERATEKQLNLFTHATGSRVPPARVVAPAFTLPTKPLFSAI